MQRIDAPCASLAAAAVLAVATCTAQVPNEYFGRGVWRGNVVDFRIVQGWAIVEGDIIAGRASELTDRYRSLNEATPERKSGARESIAVADQAKLWPDGVVPYEIDPVIQNTTHIDAAVQHWSQRTTLKFVPRGAETNYVKFVPFEDPTACASSFVGMRGGMQSLFTSEACGANVLIHEIGHAIGLFHEQARTDRDRYVRLFWENLTKPGLSQYGASAPSVDYGPYDYYSVMHYRGGDSSKNGAVTMETKPPGIPMGQLLVLSDGDIDAVNRMYGKASTSIVIGSTPPGLELMVDGESVTTPRAFDWAADSVHRIEAPAAYNDSNGRYEFARWSDNGDRAHSITVKPETATLYTASFVRYNKFNLRVTPEDAGTIRLLPESPDGYYRDDTRVTFAAIPNPGYVFAHWAGPFIEHNINLTNLISNPVSFLVDGDFQNFTARFVPAGGTISSPSNRTVTRFTSMLASGEPITAAVRIDGKVYYTPVSFVWDPGSTHEVDIATMFPINADRSLRSFQGWNDGAGRVRLVTTGDQAITYTATYSIQYGLFPATVGSGRVALNPASPTFYFDAGSTVELSAIPADTTQFVGWGSDLGGNQNPKTAVMRESIEAIAFFGAPAAVSNFGIMNAARQRPNTQVTGSSIFAKISPGEVVTINAPGVGPDAYTESVPPAGGAVPTRVADTRVLIGSVAVPVISAAPGQITAVVPYGASVLVGRSAGVQVEYQGRTTGAGIVAVVGANPAIYTVDGSGSGQGRVTNEDGTVNGPDNPAPRGSVIAIAATGLGITSPIGFDNRVSPNPGPRPAGELEVRIGGVLAEVVSAGIAAGQLGIHRIEARVPATAQAGATASIILTLEGAPSQVDVTMAVR